MFRYNNFSNEYDAFDYDRANRRNFRERINVIKLVIGNSYDMKRQFGIPFDNNTADAYQIGSPVKAWFTVKANPAFLDNQSVVQKIITPSADINNGLITYYANSNIFTANFYISPSDSSALVDGIRYFYSYKYLTSSGRVYTSEMGILYGFTDITLANS